MDTNVSDFSGKYITVKTRNYVSKVYLESIIYLHRENRKIHVGAVDGDYRYYDSMRHIKEQLNGEFFFPVNGIAINLAFVDRVDDKCIRFENGEEKFLSSDVLAKTKQVFYEYLKEHEWK